MDQRTGGWILPKAAGSAETSNLHAFRALGPVEMKIGARRILVYLPQNR